MGDHIAHVLAGSGVTEAPFVRVDGTTYTNADDIVLKPGATLDLGNGLTLTTPAGPA